MQSESWDVKWIDEGGFNRGVRWESEIEAREFASLMIEDGWEATVHHNPATILRRKSDGKDFKVTHVGHWSDIESLDGTEKDFVKWGWDDTYVGNNSGFSYRKS